MSARSFLAVAAVALTLAATSAIRAEESADPVATLDVPAMTDEQIVLAAENLRKEGPAGLEKAQQAFFGWMIRCSSEPAGEGGPVDLNARRRRLFDLVAQQKDADVSRLYWYTDWESAQAESKRTGKPVLRLFMMGRLTDNLSCANSRFFRVAFYANERISEVLRENYVLCWTSVRPVPVITVDYGDGRKLERTVTGNSIHYIVDADGRLIDAMPGLVGPQTFLSWLIESEQKFATSRKLEEPTKTNELRRYHESALATTINSWYDLRGRITGEPVGPPTIAPTTLYAPAADPTVPRAFEAAPIAVGKGFVEVPLVAQIVPGAAPVAAEVPSSESPGSVPTAVAAAPLATSKLRVELPLVNEVVGDDPNAALTTAVSKRKLEAPLIAELTPPAPAAPPAALESIPQQVGPPTPVRAKPASPFAVDTLRLAVSKSAVEAPFVTSLAGREEMRGQIAALTDAEWDRLAELFSEESALDESSIALMHRLYSDPEAPTAATCPTSTIASFERSIALDTARNLYLHRRAILEWIVDEGLPTDIVAFNERVYGELFLTPSSDPWIGLVPQDVFTGIEREGLFEN